MKTQNKVKFNKFQNAIIDRANTLSKHNFQPQMCFAGNNFASIVIPIIRDGRKGLHFMEFTKTSKSTISAKCYYEFSDDRSTIAAPIPVEYKDQMHQISNNIGIYKLNF